MAEGVIGQATITKMLPQSPDGGSMLCFSFQPGAAGRTVQGKQRTTRAAIDNLGLMIGSTVQVRYLQKWPKYGFIDAVARAERTLPLDSPTTGAVAGSGCGWTSLRLKVTPTTPVTLGPGQGKLTDRDAIS